MSEIWSFTVHSKTVWYCSLLMIMAVLVPTFTWPLSIVVIITPDLKYAPNFWTYVASQSSRTVTNIIGMVPVRCLFKTHSHTGTVPFLSSVPYFPVQLNLALIPPHLSYTNIFLQHTLIFSTWYRNFRQVKDQN